MVFEDRFRQAQRPKYDCLLFGKNFVLEQPDLFSYDSFSSNVFETADLDDTLYPLSSGIAASCLQNIKGKITKHNISAWNSCCVEIIISFLMLFVIASFVDYMVEKLGIEQSKLPDLCNLLYKNYGTTMAGLRV